MASHSHHPDTSDERIQLGDAGKFLAACAAGVGVLGLFILILTSLWAEPGFGRFYHAYLIGYAFVLSLCVGGLFIVLVNHLVKSAWIVVVRRIPETLAAMFPIVGLMALPLLIPVWTRSGELYHWAVPVTPLEHHDDAGHDGDKPHTTDHDSHASAPLPYQFVDADGHAATQIAADTSSAEPRKEGEYKKEKAAGYHTAYDYRKWDDFAEAKQPYLSPWFFTLRLAIYFVILSAIARYFVGQSIKQDTTGDVNISKRLSVLAAPCIVLFALCVTFMSFDLLMTLDHHWYSTMFGVQFFAGSAIAAFATTILAVNILQRNGFLTASVNKEHMHDLGKFLFGFVFFWGYVSFSQYMLIWYANLPETTTWFLRRGATTSAESPEYVSGYGGVSLLLLFGHFILPFAFLLSRHIKRNRNTLLFAACWLLVFHAIHLYWVVMPELDNGRFFLSIPEVSAIAGLLGVFVALAILRLGKFNLRPVKEPRLDASLAFHNI